MQHHVYIAYCSLNEKCGRPTSDGKMRTIHPGQTIVIAAGVANGGGAALAAAEEDTQGLISGVLAAEPQVQVASTGAIKRGDIAVAEQGKTPLDYLTYANLQ